MIGRHVGRYEIDALLGAGGMGEVYCARDRKLDRNVAIKILPHGLAADAERLRRFESEARALAALNHPNIATIHGVEDADGAPAIVMELIEGETLADRLAARNGGMPVASVMAIALQLADALDAAHQSGVIHRDLKPSNVKLTPDGIVKVLDFGLAKLDSASAPDAVGRATTAVTLAGQVFGTPSYMSPEQARGQMVDKRADIWALGCVLFELLAGRVAFSGSTTTDVLAAVLDREPDWSQLPRDTPPQLRRLLRRCLAKDPRQRLRDCGDIAAELEEVSTEAPARKPLTVPLAAAALALIAVAVGAAALWPMERDASTPAENVLRTTVFLPDDQRLPTEASDYPLALSPDGTKLAYVAGQGGARRLFVRALNSLDSVAIPGTASARHPFFSPDGQWIGFFADGSLQKVAASGSGTPLRIATVADLSQGASWGSDGTIVYALRGGELMRVSSNGGVGSPLDGADPAQWPQILPDGKTVLFTTGVRGVRSAIATIPIEGGVKRIVAQTGDAPFDGPPILGTVAGIAQARFIQNSGLLVYGVSQNPGAIRALRVDPDSMEALGPAMPLADAIERGPNGGAVYFAVSASLLVYASTRDDHELVWVDRRGAITPISPDRAAFRLPELSPDGARIVIAVNDETRRSDIWVYEAERGTKRRLTSERHNLDPIWTPDGRSITFASGGLSEVAVDGSGTRTTLLSTDELQRYLPAGTSAYPKAWSPDGSDLLFGADQLGLWIWSRGSAAPRPLIDTPFNDYLGRFSPDGRWLAYVSDETGEAEVYAVRYPDLGVPVAISTDGGTSPRWSRDGKELFYKNGDALMSVAVDTRETLNPGQPQLLFTGQFAGAGRAAVFDVSPDGQRFVMVRSDPASTLDRLTVVQHWLDDLSP